MAGCRPLTNDEIKQINASFVGCNALRDKCWFWIGLNCGFRISEICSLNIGSVIDDHGRIVQAIEVDRCHMKGKKRGRSVSVNNAVRQILNDWLPELEKRGYQLPDHPLFPTTKNRRLCRKGAWRIINRIKKSLGLQGKIATHSMRKTFGTNVHQTLLDRASDGERIDVLLDTMRLMGHADPKSTTHYLEDSFARKNDIIHSLNLGL